MTPYKILRGFLFLNCLIVVLAVTTMPSSIAATPADEIGAALGQPDWNWTTGGDAPWFTQNEVQFDGMPAAQSGPISDDQSSWIEAVIEGPGVLNFAWRTSSEWHFDPLRFTVNDGSEIRLSGESEWEERIVRLPPGQNIVRWAFTKNQNLSHGEDAGWLADITWSKITDYIHVEPSSLRISAAAHSYAIEILSDREWSVTAHPDWVSIHPHSGNGDSMVAVAVEAAPTIAPRRGTLLIGEARHSIAQLPVPERRFAIRDLFPTPDGRAVLRFLAEPDFLYSARISDDLISWEDGRFQVGSQSASTITVEETTELEIEIHPKPDSELSGDPPDAQFWFVSAQTPPLDFIFIPAGSFGMGDHLAETDLWMADSRPAHQASTGFYYLSPTPVTYDEWRKVYDWAIDNGYAFDGYGQRGADENWNPLPDTPAYNGHPVVNMTWHDAVKWCNAKSEMAGREPVYYTDSTFSEIYRSGKLDLASSEVKWSAPGYRLPTEAEWEKAARGGLEGARWPWGNDEIDSTRGNYRNGDGAEGTSAVEDFPPNPYGLYDMAGNVWEWVWDRYDENQYREQSKNPPPVYHGPGFGTQRVIRGGSWDSNPEHCRVSARLASHPETRNALQGFRIVGGSPQPNVPPPGPSNDDSSEPPSNP